MASEGAKRTEWRRSLAVSAHSRQQFSKMEWGKRRRSDIVLMANLKGGGGATWRFSSTSPGCGRVAHKDAWRRPKGRRRLERPEEGDDP
jgi:hypothetical protein